MVDNAANGYEGVNDHINEKIIDLRCHHLFVPYYANELFISKLLTLLGISNKIFRWSCLAHLSLFLRLGCSKLG